MVMIRRYISDEGKIKAIDAMDIAAITDAINYNALQDDDIIITNIIITTKISSDEPGIIATPTTSDEPGENDMIFI